MTDLRPAVSSVFGFASRKKASLSSLTAKEREEKALKLGYSRLEIEHNRLQNMKVQYQRRRSASQDRNDSYYAKDELLVFFNKLMKKKGFIAPRAPAAHEPFLS